MGSAVKLPSLGEVLKAAALRGVAEASARIFGHAVGGGDGQRSGRKILRRKVIGGKVLEWYPRSVANKFPGFTPREERDLID